MFVAAGLMYVYERLHMFVHMCTYRTERNILQVQTYPTNRIFDEPAAFVCGDLPFGLYFEVPGIKSKLKKNQKLLGIDAFVITLSVLLCRA